VGLATPGAGAVFGVGGATGELRPQGQPGSLLQGVAAALAARGLDAAALGHAPGAASSLEAARRQMREDAMRGVMAAMGARAGQLPAPGTVPPDAAGPR